MSDTMIRTSEMLRAFYGRVSPMIPELFNMAYAICGSYDLAEYALQYTLVEAWTGESQGGMGFREGLRNTLRHVACEEAMEPRAQNAEVTWDGLTAQSDDPVLMQLAQEDVQTRRAVALRYGCALNVARIAKLMNLSAARVRELIDRFERRARRRLDAAQKRRYDAVIARAVRDEFARSSGDVPSLSAIYRTFESEAAETQRPKRWLARILQRTLCVLLALLCGVVFWLAAVLVTV